MYKKLIEQVIQGLRAILNKLYYWIRNWITYWIRNLLCKTLDYYLLSVTVSSCQHCHHQTHMYTMQYSRVHLYYIFVSFLVTNIHDDVQYKHFHTNYSAVFIGLAKVDEVEMRNCR